MTAASPQGKKPGFYIPSLDGIRAVSFLIVFLAHAGLGRIVPGGFGVTVFFFLSGYLITTLLRMEFDQHQTIGFKQFYLRRALRIFPPYYIVLAIAIGFAAVGALSVKGELGTAPILAQVLYFANFWKIYHGSNDGWVEGTGVYWSLSIEEHFYLLFPLMYFALRRLKLNAKQQALALLGLCGVILVWRCVLVFGMGADDIRTYYGSDTRFDSMLFGCILAIFGNPALDPKDPLPDRVWKQFLFPLSIVILLLTLAARSKEFHETFRYTIQGIALWPVFIVAIRYPDWGIFKLLNVKWVKFLGMMSYTLYLVHYVIINGIKYHRPELPMLWVGVLGFALSLAVSYLMFRFVEKPLAVLRKRLHQKSLEAAKVEESKATV